MVSKRTWLMSAALAGALSICGSVTAQPSWSGPLPINNPTLAFDKHAFEAKVRSELDSINSGAGYAAIVIKDGQRVHDWATGYAVRPGFLPAYPHGVHWTVNTPSNVGSTTKMLSTVLLLRAFQMGYEGKTVEQWLDTKIVPYLPKAWRQYALTQPGPRHDALRQVTFRDLLQHRTGWPTTQPSTHFGRIVQGVDPAQVGERVYINWNYTLITYLLPRVMSPPHATAADSVLANVNLAVASNFP